MSRYANYLRSVLSGETETSSDNDSSITTQRAQKRKRDDDSSENMSSESKRRARGADAGDTATNSEPSISQSPVSDPGEGTSRGPSRRNNPTRHMPSPSFPSGTTIYSNQNVRINIQSVEHQRHTRFRAEDHLYQINIVPIRRSAPLLLSLETALEESLKLILLKLQKRYSRNLHHQVYITIIENNILHGLNTGNYDLGAPPTIIINRVLTILHSYLKSNQTMKLNDSFKVQIKILSHNHSNHLQRNNPRFQKHIFRDFRRIRN